MWQSRSYRQLCSDLELRREHSLHQKKLSAVKATVDRTKPSKPVDPRLGKKAMHARDRLDEIQKDNAQLLTRMVKIEARVLSLNSDRRPLSLNRGVRISALKRIAHENEALLRRLRKAESCYSAQQWAQERRRTAYWSQQISLNASRLPLVADYSTGSLSGVPERVVRGRHAKSRSEVVGSTSVLV